MAQHVEPSAERIRRQPAAAREVATQDKPVRYLQSTFTPGHSRCRCLVEAPNADQVQEVNDDAQLAYGRIVLALDQPAS